LSVGLLVFVRVRLHRSPTSPLFPYTTLFRSKNEAAGEVTASTAYFAQAIEEIARRADEVTYSGEAGVRVREDLEKLKAYWLQKADRKSTRLNSSHGSISYAVFCLKKKKTKLK